MAASLITVLLFYQLMSASADSQIIDITAHPGDDVTLPCPVPNNVNIARVELIRSDLNRSVCTFQDKQLIPELQHPSYKNRVQLKDDGMKNGDLSLVLKNMNSNDEGRYQCRYVEERGGRNKRSVFFGFKPTLSFHLHYGEPQRVHRITANKGQDVLLICEAPKNVTITTVEWLRTGLNGSVCTFKQVGLIPTYEHQSYLNRLEMRNHRSGNLSMILREVISNDTGTYVCLYEGKEGADPFKLINIVHLDVAGGAVDGKYAGGRLGVVLPISLIAALVIF